jgi:hypothetical protein
MDDAKHEEGKRVALLMAQFYLANVRPRQDAQYFQATGQHLGLQQKPEASPNGHDGTSTLRHHREPSDSGVRGLDVPVSGPVSELPLQGVCSTDSGSVASGDSNK